MPTYGVNGNAVGQTLETNGVLQAITMVTAPGLEQPESDPTNFGLPKKGYFCLVDSGVSPVPRQLVNCAPQSGGCPPPGSPLMAGRNIPFGALRVQSVPVGSAWTVTTA
jgi:hypothetical protein